MSVLIKRKESKVKEKAKKKPKKLEENEDEDDEDYVPDEDEDEDEDDEDYVPDKDEDEDEEFKELDDEEFKELEEELDKLIEDQEPSGIMNFFKNVFKKCFPDKKEITEIEYYKEISGFFEQDKCTYLDIQQLKDTIKKIFKTTRSHTNYSLILRSILELNKPPTNLYITENIYDILVIDKDFKVGEPIKTANELLEFIKKNKNLYNFFIFKIVYNYRNKNGKENSHIILIHYDQKKNRFTLIDTTRGEIPYKYQPGYVYEEPQTDENIRFNVNMTLLYNMKKISEIYYPDSKLELEYMLLPNIQRAEKLYNIGGLCQIWTLFFIYYYLVGFKEKKGLEALEEISIFFREIKDPIIYTKILTVWCYIHFNILRGSKALFVFKPKTKKSKPKKSKTKKSKTKKSKTKKSKPKKSKPKKSKPKKSKSKKSKI